MNYSKINKYDIANGDGVRVTLFVSGCRNHCRGCFQPETWNFSYGRLFTSETQDEIIKSCSPDYIAGLTLLGGDPFEEENQIAILPLVKEFKIKYPRKSIWAFTGYLYEDLLVNGKKYTEYTDEILQNIDILVDGPFVESKKNLMLAFRGSENQRIIDVKQTLQNSHVMLSPLNDIGVNKP